MSDSSDEDQCRDSDDCGGDGPQDLDQFTPPDPLDADDRDWLAAQLDRDTERMRHEPLDVPDDDPPELTAEEFACEILDGGADAAAGLLSALEPGPRAAALLAMLQPASLSPASMVSVIAATEKLASWVQARQHRWLATFACPGVAAPVDDLRTYASQPGQPLNPGKSRGKGRKCQDDELVSSGPTVFGDPDVDTVLDETAMKVAAAEVGAALHFSPIAAQRRVCQAVEFAVDLPGTLRALEEGSIDRGRSLTIAERTQNLPVELRRRVERAVLPKATTRTPGQLRGIVDRAVISVDPAAAKKRHEKAVAQRNVTHRSAEDGMGVFRAELSADKAQLAFNVIDQLAYQLKRTNLSACDPRGVGALRADVFSDLIDQLASTGTVTIRSTLRRRASENRGAPQQATSTDSSDPASEPGRFNDVSRPGCSDDVSRPGCSDDVSRPGCSDDVSRPGCSDDVGQPDCSEDVGQPDCSEDVGQPDCSEDVGQLDCSDDVGQPDCANDAGQPGGGASQDATAESGVVDRRSTDDSALHDMSRCGSEGFDWAALLIGAVPATGASPTAGGPSSGSAERAGSPRVSGAPRHGVFYSGNDLGSHQGRITHLNVTIAASTLAGLDERPGDLDGHGPIPADLARAIAASASTVAAIVIKSDCGTGLDLGRTVYRPRLAQRDHVTIRDQTCRFPGCRRPAKRCQIDHSDEFCPGDGDGGVTCPCNLQCLCVFHHGLKTSGLWDSVQHSDASVTWTSPTGRTYSTQPRQWPTDNDDASVNNADKDNSEDRASAEDIEADPPPF